METIPRRTALKIAFGGLCALAIPTAIPQIAFAATKWSAFKSETWDSPKGWIKISARNGVDSVNLKGTAYTQITTDKTVPAGKLHSIAKLTNGAGIIIGSTKYTENAKAAKSVTSKVSGKGTGYQSRGWACCCYSSSCRYIYPAWPKIAKSSIPSYRTNQDGQTLGSINDAPSPFALPDLIAVQADNGRQGYAYREEICPMPTTEEEFKKLSTISQVIVYESDGVTPVGIHTLQ